MEHAAVRIIVGHEAVETAPRGQCFRSKVAAVEDEASGDHQTLDQCLRRRRIVRPREVVRDLCPEPNGGDSRLMGRKLNRCLHAGRHVEGRRSEPEHGELRRRRSSGKARWSGVRRRSRVGTEADDAAYTEALGELDDGLTERAPVVVGLDTVQEQHIVPGAVAAADEFDLGPVERRGNPFDNVHHRSASPVIEEPLGLETCDRCRVDLLENRFAGICCAAAGIDPSGEVDQEDRIIERRRRQQCVQLGGVDRARHRDAESTPNRWDAPAGNRPVSDTLVGAMADVTDATFETAVIERSHQVPVVIDLWAEWCGPCKQLGPILDKVIGDTNGKVELAKVDVDANTSVAQAFQVQSIPAVYAMKDGQVVDGFMGAQGEAQVREFVAKLLPTEEQNEIERLLEIGDVESLNAAFALEPDNPDVLTALAAALIDEGQVDQGIALLDKIPETPETRRLRALARTNGDTVTDIDATLTSLLPTVKLNDDDRQKFVDLLEVLGPDDPRTPEWRRKLSTALF